MSPAAGKSPAMPVYVKDVFTDERFTMLGFGEQGLYWRLLGHQWLEGSIPGTLEELVKLTGRREVRKLWPAVSQFFGPHPTEPGRLANEKLETVRAAMLEHRRGRAEAGAKGAAARWQCDCDRGGGGDGNAINLPHAKTCLAFAFASASSKGNPPLPPRKRGGRRITRAEAEARVGGRPEPSPEDELAGRRGEHEYFRGILERFFADGYGDPYADAGARRRLIETHNFPWVYWCELEQEFNRAAPLELVAAATH